VLQYHFTDPAFLKGYISNPIAIGCRIAGLIVGGEDTAYGGLTPAGLSGSQVGVTRRQFECIF
jgi:hypothetical protein